MLSASQLKECTYMPLVLKFSNPGVNAPHGAVASSISLWHSSRYKTLILTICAILSLSVPSRGSCDPAE